MRYLFPLRVGGGPGKGVCAKGPALYGGACHVVWLCFLICLCCVGLLLLLRKPCCSVCQLFFWLCFAFLAFWLLGVFLLAEAVRRRVRRGDRERETGEPSPRVLSFSLPRGWHTIGRGFALLSLLCPHTLSLIFLFCLFLAASSWSPLSWPSSSSWPSSFPLLFSFASSLALFLFHSLHSSPPPVSPRRSGERTRRLPELGSDRSPPLSALPMYRARTVLVQDKYVSSHATG